MKKIAAIALAVLSAASANAAISITPMTSFGGGDGWLSPAEYARLGIASESRGLAYNPVTKNLLLATSQGTPSPSIRVLNSLSGVETGTLNTAGITGGDRAINQIGVAADGAIYVANLRARQTAANTYRIYRFSDESATATVAFSGSPLIDARIGDSFDVIGSGANTRLVAGYGNAASPAPQNLPGANGYAVFSSVDGLAYTAENQVFPVSPAAGSTATGDFRLGITFTDADSVIGTASQTFRISDYAAGTGTLVSSYNSLVSGNRIMDYAEIGGLKLLAVARADTNAASGRLRIYDVSDPLNVTQLIETEGGLTTTSGTLTTNANGTGQIKFGEINGNTANLYVMSTNQGIQAFTIVVPEPTTLGLAALAVPALLRRRRA